MKTHLVRFLVTSAVAVAALSLESPAFAETGTMNSAETSHDVRLASKNDLKCRADKLAGKELTGRDGKKLGSIKDFLIEADSGRIRFAVLSTGGFAGVGDTLHLIPYYMLSQTGKDGNFMASITRDMLSRAPALDEETFEQNRVNVDRQEEQQIADAFSASGANVRSTLSPPSLLLRATKLSGRDVEANGIKLGRLQGVVIDRGATHAVAVLKAEHGVANGEREFLVPLTKLKITAGKDTAVTTTVSQSELQAAEPANATASNETNDVRQNMSARQSSNVAGEPTSGTTAVEPSSSHVRQDEAPSPTGQTSAEQNFGATPSLVSAAHSIRHALDADSGLAQADVRVTPEKGRVVIQGTVNSDEQKAAVERAADNAANGANIDFDLTVHGQ